MDSPIKPGAKDGQIGLSVYIISYLNKNALCIIAHLWDRSKNKGKLNYKVSIINKFLVLSGYDYDHFGLKK